MTFQTFPINITGPSYQSRSRPLSSQETKNFYHAVVEAGKDQYVLHSFPGLKLEGTATGGADRGMRAMAGVGFRVVGNTLYEFNAAGTHFNKGTIPGSNRCILSDDGFNLIIVSDSGVFQYDGTSVTTVTDSNIVGSTAVTYLNSQMIYTNPPLFVVADPDIPNQASGLNAASADSAAGVLVHSYAFQQTLYNLTTTANEPWWNSGTGKPPFDRIDNQIMEVGCAAVRSVAHTDEFLYWLGDDLAIYQASGGTKRRVSTPAISNAISKFNDISDAISFTVTFENMNFYVLSFINDDQTWILNEGLGTNGWDDISSGTQGGVYQGTSLINVYDKNYVADINNGNLYTLDIDTYQNNGEIIQRRRVTSSVNGKLLGAPGKEVEIDRFQVIMEKGVGLITGQGEDPQIMIDISFDGGKSWNEQGFADTGRLGETQILVELFPQGRRVFHDAIFRLTTSDGVPYEIFSAAVDLRLTGG